jgi:putative ATPase
LDSLFGDEPAVVAIDESAPLAARLRPVTFDEVVGQSHLVAPGAAFRTAAELGRLGSVILWGPPGVGKTTLAEIVAAASGAHIVKLSATSAGVADLRKVIEEARRMRSRAVRTVLFIDEIHRFNKSQQDAVLPVVEEGLIILIGATTENPSFEVNSALLSRARVFVLNPLTDEELVQVQEKGALALGIEVDADAHSAILLLSNGDARASLNILELSSALLSPGARLTLKDVESAAQRRTLLYDKNGEGHFDLISALHKSVRDSDIDGSLYWLVRMLEAGEEPLYLARRLVRMASEDIGLADPNALVHTMAAQQAVHFLGMPEAALALCQATAYLAAAPKSNAIYAAYGAIRADLEQTRNDPVPMHLRNAATKLMKGLGYGAGYQYAHDAPDAKVDQQHLPDSLVGRTYYHPTSRGWEAKLV